MDASRNAPGAAQPHRLGWLASRWLIAGVALLVLVLLFGRSMLRRFDMDEHQFVAPAVFLSEKGLFPYTDYPYFHMPTLIYLQAPLMACLPGKLLAARLLSVLCGWVTLLLLARTGWRALAGQPTRTRCLLVGGVMAAYLCSRLFVYTNGWAWNHDAATLCAVGAYLLQLRGMRQGQLWCLALAGALAGLAVGIRLSFAFIVLPLGVGVCLMRSPLTWRRRALGLAGAGAAALLVLIPALLPWIQDSATFVFGNLGYAELNTRYYARAGGSMSPLGKLYYPFPKFFADPGDAFLFLMGMYSIAYAFWKHRAWRSLFGNELCLLLALLPVLFVGAAAPNPIQQQYLYMLLPFLTLAGFYVMALDCADPVRLRWWRRCVLWGALLPAVVGLPRWYWPVIHLPRVNEWTPVLVHRTGEWIKEHCPPNARVLTADPVFPLEAGLTAYPEYAAGRFIFHVGDLMTPPDRRRFHMAWGEELARVLADRPPDAIFRDRRAPTEALAEYARAHNFRKLEHRLPYLDRFAEAEQFELWVRETGSP